MSVQETNAPQEASTADLRESVLSEWPSDNDDTEGTPAAEEKAEDEGKPDDSAEDADEESEDEGDEGESDDEDEDEDESEDEDDDSDDDAEEEDAGADDDDDKPDEVAAKRIAAIQAEEKRAKQAIAEQRQQLQQEMQALEAIKGDVEEFKSLRANARFDPLGTLLKLGLGDDDLEPAAKLIYAASPKGREDPKLREDAARVQKMRGHDTELETVKQELAAIKQREAEREQQAQYAREAAQYMQRVTGAVNGKTPIVSALIKNDPAMADERLRAAAQVLINRTGEIPEPADVVAELEAERVKELKAMGIEPPKPARKKKKKKSGTKKNTAKATETKKAAQKTETTTKPPDEGDDHDPEWELRQSVLGEKWPDE